MKNCHSVTFYRYVVVKFRGVKTLNMYFLTIVFHPAGRRDRLKAKALRADQPGRFTVLKPLARMIYRRADTPHTCPERSGA